MTFISGIWYAFLDFDTRDDLTSVAVVAHEDIGSLSF